MLLQKEKNKLLLGIYVRQHSGICGSMVSENCQPPASTEISGLLILSFPPNVTSLWIIWLIILETTMWFLPYFNEDITFGCSFQ